MKNFRSLIILLFLPILLYSQTSISVEETRRLMSKGDQPGFLVRIPETSLSDVERSWMREIRKGSKAKPAKSREEISIQGAMINTIRNGAMNVYARLYQDSKDVLLYAFFEIDSVFFDGYTDRDLSGNVKNYLREFAVNRYREAFAKVVTNEERTLDRLEKAVSSAESANKKSERDISKNERRISDLNKRIKEISGDEDRKAAEIERQKNLIATLQNFPEEQKAARSKLKSLEKERRKLTRNRESSHKRIDKLDESIKRARRNIRLNEEKMRLQNREIDQQRSKVMEMKNKLAEIR